MKCSFDECNNKAECGIGWGRAKGTIPICKECMTIYREHCRARDKFALDDLKAKINKVLSDSDKK